jgi:hypothetical protein
VRPPWIDVDQHTRVWRRPSPVDQAVVPDQRIYAIDTDYETGEGADRFEWNVLARVRLLASCSDSESEPGRTGRDDASALPLALAENPKAAQYWHFTNRGRAVA